VDDADNVLYVGKAKNLKNRIASYKQWQQTRGKTRRLVFSAKRLKHAVLESELEALLVEAELIRTHQPPFNILLKDDKTPLYIFITQDEYPRVLTIRKKELQKSQAKGTILGPFQSAYQLKQVLQIARRIFPYCNQLPPTNSKTLPRPCFYYHLDLCPGACIGKIPVEEYRQTIDQLILFLKGKKKDVVKKIEDEMKAAAAAEKYELAAELRDRVSLIKAVTEQKYKLKPDLQYPLPKLKESLKEEGVIYLRRLLSTYMSIPKNYSLDRMECYDVSNIQGTNAAVAMVTFTGGEPNKGEYRLFNIKTLDTPNDFAMLREALLRRQNHPEWGIPDLLIIDGGKGQLRSVLSTWHWTTPVISIAKKPDRLILPILEHGQTQKLEDTPPDLTHLKYQIINLPENHPTLTLVQQLRDEAHRFSKKQHSKLRERNMFD
jgi:excinuclease ABC subunit C